MAETWGDIIARNYSAGRALADDFVTSRFQKKADALRTQYEDRAKAENKKLQDYMPDLEADLRALAASTGATRRGIANKKGEALDITAMGRIREDVARAGEQRAGALALSGDQAGARRERAGAQYSVGNFDAGFGQQQAGDTIAATAGAVGADGAYDAKKGALGLARVGAQYGDGQQAAQQTEAADTFRMKSAAAKATQLYNLISHDGEIDNDQFVGLWEGIKEDLPEFKNVDLRLNDGKVYIYEGGKATGELEPAEAAQLLNKAIQAPGAAIQSSMAAQLKSIEDQKARTDEVDKKILEASTRVIEKLSAAGVPESLTNAFINAQKEVASGGGGFKLNEIGEEPGTYIVENGGERYIVKTNQPAGGAGSLLSAGGATDTVQVFDLNDNPVPPEVLNKAGLTSGGAAASAIIKLAHEQAKAGTEANFEVLNQQLQLLNNLGNAYGGSQKLQRPTGGGGGTSRAERNNNPGNIEDGAFAKSLPGYAGGDGRFAKFDSPEAGAAAQSKLLESYMGRGFDTVEKIVGRWSPQSDPTNAAGSASNYAKYVASQLGVDPTQKLTAEQLPALAQAMAQFESGNRGGALPSGTAASARTATASAAAPTAAPANKLPAALPKRPGVSRGTLAQQTADMLTKSAEVDKKKEALAQFDKDNGTRMSFVPGRSIESAGGVQALNLSPDQRAVREQLLADIVAAEEELTSMRAGVRRATEALNRDTAGKNRGALYARYGGSADFFNRAGGAGGGSQ